MEDRLKGRGARIAAFHMITQTEKQCERRGRVYGSRGEIEHDGTMIRVYDFATSEAQVYYPQQAGGGHGGGDDGLTRQFIRALEAAKRDRLRCYEAQQEHIGCTLDDIIRSHAMAFAAEEARRDRRVIDWAAWWQKKVVPAMQDLQSWRRTLNRKVRQHAVCSVFDVAKVDCASIFMQEAKKQEGLFKDSSYLRQA
ncbi:MAG: hypothetical protein Q9198_004526 [Flavoplaca austrocitrina]